MDLYNIIKNVYGANNEAELANAVEAVRETIGELEKERMCKVYSGFLLQELKKRHVPARLINTTDLGISYEHEFVLVPSNDEGYYLADLTYSQFHDNSIQLRQLLNAGYQYMDSSSWNRYVYVVSRGNSVNELLLDNAFYSHISPSDSIKYKM
jgi:hypothetical protein